MAHVVDRGCGRSALAAALGLAVLGGCRREEPPPAPVAAEPSARPAPASELHEETFDLRMKPVGTVTAGQPATVEITVDAKGGYHPNEKYPYKFKPAEAPGVRYASPAFSAEAVKLEPRRATLTVSFTPEGKGDRTIAGLFAFSLCSADQCLIEKRDLALQVGVN
jgi:hypothetical protein